MTKPALVIDGQLFQTNTWNRGMGKYSLDLLDSLSKAGFFTRYADVYIILSTRLKLSPERGQTIANIHRFLLVHLPLKTLDKDDDTRAIERDNRSTLNDYVAHHPAKDVHFLTLSLFEDLAAPTFPDNASRKILLIYDIIPYLFSAQYLGDKQSQKRYFGRFPALLEADQILTISETTREDLIAYIGLDRRKIHNINGAPISLQRSNAHPKRPSSAPNGRFILLPSGNDIRKNNERAIRAFELFNQRHGYEYSLLITSAFDEKTKRKLSRLSGNVVFTGNVSEKEIPWLFEHAEAILFPTLYEGLGLPILEAIAAKTTPACSDIPVFREMSTPPALDLFNPNDVADIARILDHVIEKPFNAEKYESITRKYRWENTARLFMQALDSFTPEKDIRDRPKLAVVAPHTAGLSTIAKVVQTLHPDMQKNANVTYYLENNDSYQEKVQHLTYIADCRDIAEFNEKAYQKYDSVLYHIGNSDYHCLTYWWAQRLPGFVVLHDTDLSGLGGVLAQRGYLSPQRVILEEKLTEMLAVEWSKNTVSLLNSQLGVITHSLFAKKEAERALIVDGIDVSKLNLPVAYPTPPCRNYTKPSLNIGLAGILHSVKGLEIVRTLAADPDFSEHRFSIFGFSFATSSESIDGLASLPNVEIATDVSDFEFQTRLASLDILINYRLTYRGETSYSTLEAMRLGVVVLVRDVGWYSELSDTTVAKIGDESAVKEALQRLCDDRGELKSRSEHSVRYVQEHFSTDSYAGQTVGVVERQRENINETNRSLLAGGAEGVPNRDEAARNWLRLARTKQVKAFNAQART